ncbi:enoyl-CoA hydratase/isomerase family protein [Anditalea andensis]|uniref:Enoyl-CoA hydratase n=1 Tax=Anditalea andensis TaxID=1048983 RepID=A0A074KV18_9BACT|nr:enoyl-CoA hydratase/isomerase family protein [Anditalea andensis]KEO72749.1 enoyl-CoA hydratase [Anditalea andensis]
MKYNHIIYTGHSDWVELKLNRPQVYNALNRELLAELLDAFTTIETNDEIRCVLLTGEGKAFSSGQDLKAVGVDLKQVPFEEIVTQQYNPLILKMRSLHKPIICKLNGVAAGAGCSLALAADIIVASDDAYMAEIFTSIGLVMDAGSTYFLPRILGSSKAFEIATMGTKIYGKEAMALGLVNESVPELELDSTVLKYIAYYRTAPTYAIGLIKEMLGRSLSMPLADVLLMEAQYQNKAGSTLDFQEGVAAFLQKRKPNFKGK